MPIRYTKKSIFNIEADAVVNTVNCKGVMGKGLALEFKKRFPEMYKEYRRKCEEGEIRIGYIHLYEIRQKRIDSPFKFILNFPTKKDWRHKSKTEYIEEGLKYFRKYVADYLRRGIKTVVFPKLGCQHGGLNWEKEVKPLMEKYLENLDLNIYISLNEPFKIKIKELYKNQTNIIVEGIISKIRKESNIFVPKFGKSILVSCILKDDTGSVPLEIWRIANKTLPNIVEGNKVRLTGAYTKMKFGKIHLILSLDKNGKIERIS